MMEKTAKMVEAIKGPLMDQAVEVASKMTSSGSNIEEIGDSGFVVVRAGTPEFESFESRNNGFRYPVVSSGKSQDFVSGIGFYIFENEK